MLSLKTLTILAVIGVAGAANAQFAFTSISANYTLDSTNATWNSIPDNLNGMIDFVEQAPAFKVGDSTGFLAGSSTISFNVTSAQPVDYIDLVFQGNVQDWGRVTFSETVTGGAGTLGSVSGTVLGGNYSGGANGAFTHTVRINFSTAVTQFSVTKNFALDINGQSIPSTSIAGVSLVEQNLHPVPEPASMAALGLGVAALIRRRRSK